MQFLLGFRSLLLAYLLNVSYGFVLTPTSLRKSPNAACTPARLSLRNGRLGAVPVSPLLSTRMQWKDSEELYQDQWDPFVGYNLGRWKGRTLHLSPQTGEYIKPFATNHVVDVMQNVEGAQSAKMRTMTGDDSAPRMTESVITINEDFQCSDDGSYSLDRTFSEIPEVDGTARFTIEMSIKLTEDERVRFQAFYDFESKLSRIVLYEEYRVVSTGATRLIGIKLDNDKREPAVRSPLTMLSLIGEFRGEAVGRRTVRMGGGELKFAGRSGLQWDGKTIRRELEVVDERLRSARKINWGVMDGSMSEVVTLDDGYKLIVLPSGCWCCVPERLETSSPSEGAVEYKKPDNPPPQAAGVSAGQTDTAKLEAMLAGSASDGEVVSLRAFTAEFGCYLDDTSRKRIVRLYNTDGTVLTTTTVNEKRAGQQAENGSSSKGAMYDEFE